MRGKSHPFCPATKFDHVFGRVNPTTPAIVGVFDAKQLRAKAVMIFRVNDAVHLVDLHRAALPCHGLGDKARQCREGSLFILEDVAIFLTDKRVAVIAVHPQCDLVCHRATGNENCRLFA